MELFTRRRLYERKIHERSASVLIEYDKICYVVFVLPVRFPTVFRDFPSLSSCGMMQGKL